jgi:hypothetical protein
MGAEGGVDVLVLSFFLPLSSMVASFAASSMLFSIIYRFEYRVSFNPVDPKNPAVIAHLAQYLGLLAAVIFGVAVICAFFVRKIGPVGETSEARPLLEDTCADTPPLRLFLSLNFWLCFASIFLIAGPGLLWITAQGSIVVSRKPFFVYLFPALFLSFLKVAFPPSTTDNLVLVLGAGSVLGRLVTGFASDAIVTRFSRALFFIPGGQREFFVFFI